METGKKTVLFGISLLLLTFTFLNSAAFCQDIDSCFTEINRIVKEVKDEYCPDKRLGIFSIEVVKSKKILTLKGELSEQIFYDKLIGKIKVFQKDISIKNEIIVFPDKKLEFKYALAKSGVIDIRGEPDKNSELVTQALLGQVLKLYRKDGDWFLAKLDKDYIGWVFAGDIYQCEKEFIDKWNKSVNVIVSLNFTKIYDKPFIKQIELGKLVAGSKIILIRSGAVWSKVLLPGSKEVWIETNSIKKYDPFAIRKMPTGEDLIATGIRFLGITYLWGGKSPYGFDCSGFTKMVYLLNGIDLPRDASMQALCGKEIEIDENYTKLKTGDLLLFGRRRVSHVAIYIKDGWYIHSSGYVRINNLIKDHDAFVDYRSSTLLHVKRILK